MTAAPESNPVAAEPSMAVRIPLPPRRALLDFVSGALAAFQSSSSAFNVVCTATNHGSPSSPGLASGTADPEFPKPVPPRSRPRKIIVLDSSFNPPTTAHMRMAISALKDIRDHGETNLSGVRLLLLLALNNADKAAKPAAFEQRLAMMYFFARDIQGRLQSTSLGSIKAGEEQHVDTSDAFAVDVALAKQPYFHDKSEAIAVADFYKGTDNTQPTGTVQRDTEQVILAGYDTLIRIFNPKYYGPPTAGSELAKSEQTPMQKALGPMFRRATLHVTMRTDAEWGDRNEQTAYLDKLLNGDALEKVGGSREWAGKVEMVEGRKEGEEVVSSTLAREAAEQRNWERLKALVTPSVGAWIQSEELYGRDQSKPE